MELPIIQPRTCGTCTMCCKLMAVESIDKPVNTWCKHADPKRGCRIHDMHRIYPEECRSFSCQWLRDHTIPDEYRPDRIKTVIVSHQERNRVVMFIDPTVPFEGKVREAVELLKYSIGLHFEVYVIRGDERSISGQISPESWEVLQRAGKI